MTENREQLEKRLYKQARARVGFRVHLLIYLAVILFLWAVNLLIMWNINLRQWFHWWAIWPTLGWGLGVLIHGISVFTGRGMVDREYARLRRKHGLDTLADE
jgi:small-conductance mechanosensitive channel